jgi:drug/metabolite transporter (DMT)-like permease
VMTGLMGIPVLGEWPSVTDWAAIALISIGVYVVSGGPLPQPKLRKPIMRQVVASRWRTGQR